MSPSKQPIYAVGVDVGATKIASALVDEQGNVLISQQVPTGVPDGTEAVLDRIAGSVRELVDQSPGVLAGVGIGTPGEHHPEDGVVFNAVNLGWRELPLAQSVRERIGDNLAVWTENDTNVAALGEYFFGSAKSSPNFVYIGIGSGLGSGIVLDGKILDGVWYASGEVGHLSLDPEHGIRCECGQLGCVETLVSGKGLVKSARLWIEQGAYPTRLVDSPDLTPHEIVLAAREGDSLALALFRRASRWLGFVLAVFAATTNPERIVIGGGVGQAAYDLLVPGAQVELARRVHPAVVQGMEISPSSVTSSAIGASCLVWMNRQKLNS